MHSSLSLFTRFSLLLFFLLLCSALSLSLSPFTTPSRLSILLCFDLGLISQVYRGFAGFFSFFGSVKLGAIISNFFFFAILLKSMANGTEISKSGVEIALSKSILLHYILNTNPVY